jgi:hypothetical protein
MPPQPQPCSFPCGNIPSARRTDKKWSRRKIGGERERELEVTGTERASQTGGRAEASL